MAQPTLEAMYSSKAVYHVAAQAGFLCHVYYKDVDVARRRLQILL
jgi:hypothetical protein